MKNGKIDLVFCNEIGLSSDTRVGVISRSALRAALAGAFVVQVYMTPRT